MTIEFHYNIEDDEVKIKEEKVTYTFQEYLTYSLRRIKNLEKRVSELEKK